MKYKLRGNFLKREEFHERIKHAEKYLFNLGMQDTAGRIGEINAIWFIAKMHYIQEKLGYEPKAMVIGSPDFTFQKSVDKFQASVPEGAKVIWGGNSYNFIPVEIRPDFCGMLVGGADDSSYDNILDKLYEMKRKRYEIDSVEIQLRNFSPGSHFLNVYEIKNHEELNLPERVAILHTSSNEMHKPLVKFARENGEEIKTPFGNSLILRDEDAVEYEKYCRNASLFSKEKRKLLYEEIFNNDEIISNCNHYELLGLDEAIIGSNIVNEEGGIFSITFLNILPAYLVKSRRNLSERKIKEILPREMEGWVFDKLRNANLLPHGGGHKLNSFKLKETIVYPSGKKLFILSHANNVLACEELWNIPTTYRSDDVLEKVFSLELAEPYATLEFLYGIKVDFG